MLPQHRVFIPFVLTDQRFLTFQLEYTTRRDVLVATFISAILIGCGGGGNNDSNPPTCNGYNFDGDAVLSGNAEFADGDVGRITFDFLESRITDVD